MFKIQRDLLATYHVSDAAGYYSGQDFWLTPDDPTSAGKKHPPYYLTLKMPDQDKPVFSLTTTFIPGGNTDRNVLTGFLAVDAEPGNEAGVRSPDYGRLRLLELPRNTTVPGPGQVQNNFDANTAVSSYLNLLRQGSSTVVQGNLLTLPVGGGLLYVQPVYVQSTQDTKFPLLQRVLVAFGDQIGFSETLAGALDQVFGGDAGVDNPTPGTDAGVVPDAPVEGGTPTPAPSDSPTASPSPSSAEPTPPLTDAKTRLSAALAEASQAIKDGQAALAKNDFAAYGAAQERLQTALEAAIAAENELG
jgi:uncharacterized membrane protein (UPF0182 family)